MRRTALLSLVLATSCQDYLFAPVCPQTVSESQITAKPNDPTPADILFIVDNSGSMADDQRRLADSFDAFIKQLATVPNGSYRIAVVTTDLDSPGAEKAGEQTYEWQMSAPYEVTRVHNDGCSDTGIAHGCFRGPDATTRIISSDLGADQQDALFTANVTVGSCGSGTEQGLAAAVRALSNQGGCNSNFLRDDANLVVIFVSDEQDGSPDSVSQYVEELGRFKPWKQIRAAGIIGSVDGNANGCRTVGGLPTQECGSLCSECPGASWCDSVDPNLFGGCESCSYYLAGDCCSALGGSRYQQFLGEVDGRVKGADGAIQTATLIDSICQDDFSATLRRIAAEIIFTPCYTLADMPVNPEGIAAKIGDRTLQPGVEFEVRQGRDSVQVCLDESVTFSPGDELSIYYVTSVESRPSIHQSCN